MKRLEELTSEVVSIKDLSPVLERNLHTLYMGVPSRETYIMSVYMYLTFLQYPWCYKAAAKVIYIPDGKSVILFQLYFYIMCSADI